MSYKIQITVDEELNETVKRRAKQMGLSVSSFARLALVSVLPKKGNKILEHALADIKSKKVETLTLKQFNNQIDAL